MIYCKEIIEHKIGDNTPFESVAKSLGWTITRNETEVEMAYDGSLWEKGYAPEKPESVINEEKVAEARKYLQDTDWVIVKISESDSEEEQQELRLKYLDIISKRKESRDIINELENNK